MTDHRSTPASDSTSSSPTVPDGGVKSLLAGGLLAVLGSLAATVAGILWLPAQMRVHWSLGGPFYGPEVAPTGLVLAGFTVAVAASVSAGVLPLRRGTTRFKPGAVRGLYTAAVLGWTLFLLTLQVGLVVANLV